MQENNEIYLNFEAGYEQIGAQIQEIFSTSDSYKLITDLTYVRDIVSLMTKNKHDDDLTPVLLIFTLHSYSECVEVNSTAQEIRGYLNMLCFQILEYARLANIVESDQLNRLFNKILNAYFTNSNELQALRLYESLSQYKSLKTGCNILTYFQTFTVKQLLHCDMYDKIVQLVDLYAIDTFDDILLVENGFVQNYIFPYFVDISLALTKQQNYEKAYELINISMSLIIESIENSHFQMMLSNLVFLSLILNKNRSNISILLVKHKNKIDSDLLELFQHFQCSDLEGFAYFFVLYVLKLQKIGKLLLLRIFNEEYFMVLSHKLINNRLSVLVQQVDESILLEHERLINIRIETINANIKQYAFRISPYKVNLVNLVDTKNISVLIDDAHRLIDYNRALKRLELK